MEDPVHEIEAVVRSLFQAPNASIQRDTLQRFYAPNASHYGPTTVVLSGPNSRDMGILPIYQWSRCLFDPEVEVHNVAFDKENNKIFVDCTQRWHAILLPIYRPRIRVITVFFLQRGANGKFYIKQQEEYHQSHVFPGKLLPGLDIGILVVKQMAAVACLFLAMIWRIAFRHWRPVAPF